ncbi:MAG: protein kinase [Deltaproteobacteria bacterium]|nr:protein kinase [Deltaproteobacteria bacterium]
MVKSAFGKYELIKKIGQGGMAELFLARQTGFAGFEKLVVIKRILPALVESDDSDQFVNMFVDEARLAARLNHPNIVQIFDLGFTDGQFYIAMEYVNGVDLRRMLNQAKRERQELPLEHAVKIVSTVCEALCYAHDSRDSVGRPLCVVHRDISPHNVLLSFDGNVKLTDFGIAKATSGWVKTKGGALKGKLTYMAPEQVYERPVDRRTDVFSAGLVLYEMATGHRAYRAESEIQLINLVSMAQIRPPLEIRPDLPPGLVPILQRALARDPDDRYPDALALQMALEQFLMEIRSISNAPLIGQFVRSLFPEVLRAQEKTVTDGSVSIDGLLAAAELTHGTGRPTPSSDAIKTISRATPSAGSGRSAAGQGTGPGVRPVPRPVEVQDASPAAAESVPTVVDDAFATPAVDAQSTDLLQAPPQVLDDHKTDVLALPDPPDDQRTELLVNKLAVGNDLRTVPDVMHSREPLTASPTPPPVVGPFAVPEDPESSDHCADLLTSPQKSDLMPTTPSFRKPADNLGPPLWVLAVGATLGAAILTMLLLLAWAKLFS